MKMTVQFSGVSRLWIRSLAGMAPSFHNGVLESMETQDVACVGTTCPGARRIVVATFHPALLDDPAPPLGGRSWMTLASLNRHGLGRVTPPLLSCLARTAVHRG